MDEGRDSAAFDLAVEAEKHIPGDHELARLWPDFSFTPPVEYGTSPAPPCTSGNTVSERCVAFRGDVAGTQCPAASGILPLAGLKKVTTSPTGWPVRIGQSSISSLMPVCRCPPTWCRCRPPNVNLSIRSVGTLGPVAVGRYYIDQHEVTNHAFSEKFMWTGEVIKRRNIGRSRFERQAGRSRGRKAMVEFRDATGRPGPATWEAGTYGEGEDDMPVGGVSWYEAAAYARFAGKDLPTIYHWFRAAEPRAAAYIADSGAFGAKGPARIDAHRAVGPFGTSDMAGNVKEWCWTETGDGQRFILGGGWDDSSYAYTNPEALPPFDRSATNGFRCVRYAAPVVDALLCGAAANFAITRRKSRSPRMLSVWFAACIPRRVANSRPGWSPLTRQPRTGERRRCRIGAAYGRDRVVAYLFVPKNATPPFKRWSTFPLPVAPLLSRPAPGSTA